MENNGCQGIIRNLNNCDEDHIGIWDILSARSELKEFIKCDDYQLNSFLKFFVVIKTKEVEIYIKE